MKQVDVSPVPHVGTIDNTTATIVKIIEDQNVKDVKRGIFARDCWDTTGNIFETVGHLLICISACISFAAGVWQYNFLSYLAGAINVASVAVIKFAAFAMSESKDRTTFVNETLTNLKINEKLTDLTPTTNFDASTTTV